MPVRDWTPQELARLRSLWDEGLPTAEIARRMDRTKSSIVGRAHRMKLAARASPIRPGGSGRRLDDAQRAVLTGMRLQGYTARQIAAHLGVSFDLVRRTAREINGARIIGGAAAVAVARDRSETLRAEAFRRHAQQGGGVPAPPGPAAQPIPAPPRAGAGDPVRPGDAEAAIASGLDVSSLDLPPAVATRPAVLSAPRPRACRWPMWRNDERPTQEFCGAAVRRRPGGDPCVYCPAHAARAFTCRAVEAGPVAPMGPTVGWRGAA